MDNQHTLIKGYRDLTQDEINVMNAIKTAGEALNGIVQQLRKEGAGYDQRWVSIGATDLQTGLMALTRAVARPTTF